MLCDLRAFVGIVSINLKFTNENIIMRGSDILYCYIIWAACHQLFN